MAIIQDGSHKFGILAPTVTGALRTKGFTVESFSTTKSSNRVDLNDGNGEPLDAVVVPQREEISLTLQIGNDNTLPAVGDPIEIALNDFYIITDVTVNETQEDFVRLDVTAFKPHETLKAIRFAKISGGQNYTLTSIADDSYTLNQTSQFGTTITSTSFNLINCTYQNDGITRTFVINYTPASGSIDLANSTFSGGTTVITASTDNSKITFKCTNSTTASTIGLKFV